MSFTKGRFLITTFIGHEIDDVIEIVSNYDDAELNRIVHEYKTFFGFAGISNIDQLNGYLDLEGTNITSLPEGLSVGGYLDLSGTNITSLPEGLSVGGYLDLRGTNITSLPEGLSVGGYLDLRGTNITSLPESAKIEGNIYR